MIKARGHQIKPYLVDSTLVTAIEQGLGKDAEIRAARDLLSEKAADVQEMVSATVESIILSIW